MYAIFANMNICSFLNVELCLRWTPTSLIILHVHCVIPEGFTLSVTIIISYGILHVYGNWYDLDYSDACTTLVPILMHEIVLKHQNLGHASHSSSVSLSTGASSPVCTETCTFRFRLMAG